MQWLRWLYSHQHTCVLHFTTITVRVLAVSYLMNLHTLWQEDLHWLEQSLSTLRGSEYLQRERLWLADKDGPYYLIHFDQLVKSQLSELHTYLDVLFVYTVIFHTLFWTMQFISIPMTWFLSGYNKAVAFEAIVWGILELWGWSVAVGESGLIFDPVGAIDSFEVTYFAYELGKKYTFSLIGIVG